MEIRPILSTLLRSKTAPLLIALQVAISLAILANALHVVVLRQQASVRPSGIAEEQNVFYTITEPLRKPTHADNLAQQRIDVDTLKGLPGVTSVAWVSQMPMSRSGSNSGFTTDRKQTRSAATISTYFSPGNTVATLGLKLVEGRDLTEADVVEFDGDKDDPNTTFPKVAVITRPLAEHLFPGTSAIGKPIYYGVGDQTPELRVVGVVERLQTTGASVRPAGEHSAIFPLRSSYTFSKIAVRVAPGELERVRKDAEAALRKASPAPRMVNTRSVLQDRESRYRNERALVWMLVTVSALLLLVTASGIVGMATLRVTQRKKLIGVRRALGATRRDILRYFITENFLITSGGVVAGLLLAVMLNQLLVSQLEMVKLPIAYLAYGAGALWLLGVLAVWGPARRAAGVPPAIATRSA